MNQEEVAVHKVTSGDPKKGFLSVNVVKDIKEGKYVQFIAAQKQPHKSQDESNNEDLTYRVDTELLEFNNNKNNQPQVLVGAGLNAGSENGIITWSAREGTSINQLVGSQISFGVSS